MGEVIIENSPVGESQSNGFVENAVRRAHGQVRTIKLSVQFRSGTILEPESVIIVWMIEYAADLINRYQI